MSSSTSGLLTRGQIYNKLRPFLPDDTREFWDARAAFIDSGVMHCGKIETFFELFRTCVSAFVHSKETILKVMVNYMCLSALKALGTIANYSKYSLA